MALKGIGLNGKAEIHMRKLKMWLLGLAAAAMLSVSACAQEIPEESLNGNGSVSAEENQAESADGDSQAVSSSENGGNRVSSASGERHLIWRMYRHIPVSRMWRSMEMCRILPMRI